MMKKLEFLTDCKVDLRLHFKCKVFFLQLYWIGKWEILALYIIDLCCCWRIVLLKHENFGLCATKEFKSLYFFSLRELEMALFFFFFCGFGIVTIVLSILTILLIRVGYFWNCYLTMFWRYYGILSLLKF